MEVELRLEDLHLIQRDVFKLLCEAGNALVHTILMSEERANGIDLFELCRPKVVEVETIVDGSCQTLHQRVILTETSRHLSHTIHVCNNLHSSKFDCIFKLFIGKDICG